MLVGIVYIIAQKLLRPIAYYENQFAHMTNLEERQIDVEFLYTLRLIMTSLFRYSLLSFPNLIISHLTLQAREHSLSS
jgi:hypothetical protein